MKIQYESEYNITMGLGDNTTCFYQFIFDENDSNYTNIIQYFIIHGLGLFIKFNIYLSHMFYACSFSHNTSAPIAINQNKYILSVNTYTIVFACVDGNSNKNRT